MQGPPPAQNNEREIGSSGALLIQCERDSRLCRSVANVPPTQLCWR